MKAEVYSWRVSTELKTNLERAAQRRKMSVSAVLELAALQWLEMEQPERDDDAEQLRLHAAASKCFGAFAGGDAHRSENASETMRQDLKRRYGR